MSKSLPTFQTISTDELELMGLKILMGTMQRGKLPNLLEASSTWKPGPLNITCWAVYEGELEIKHLDKDGNITGKTLWQTLTVHRGYVKEYRQAIANMPDHLVAYANDTTSIGRRDKPQAFRFKRDGSPMPNTLEFLTKFHQVSFTPRLPRLTFDEERALKMFHVFSKLYKHSPRPA